MYACMCVCVRVCAVDGDRSFDTGALLALIPMLIMYLPIQYITIISISCLRPYSFAAIFNCLNHTYVRVSCHCSQMAR